MEASAGKVGISIAMCTEDFVAIQMFILPIDFATGAFIKLAPTRGLVSLGHY